MSRHKSGTFLTLPEQKAHTDSVPDYALSDQSILKLVLHSLLNLPAEYGVAINRSFLVIFLIHLIHILKILYSHRKYFFRRPKFKVHPKGKIKALKCE